MPEGAFTVIPNIHTYEHRNEFLNKSCAHFRYTFRGYSLGFCADLEHLINVQKSNNSLWVVVKFTGVNYLKKTDVYMLTGHSAELWFATFEYRWHFHCGSTSNWRNSRNNRKIDSKQNVVVISLSESALNVISSTYTWKNTLHITEILKDKTESL